MRIGYNDTKDAPSSIVLRRHRVITPVYIPHLTGYYQHLLEILRMTLESLRITAGEHIRVTVVANACCREAIDRMQRFLDEGSIDQLVINNENWGRIDGVLSAARGGYEELLTLTDSDVMFKPGWLDVLENLFRTFPECGMASIVPHPAMGWYHTSATVLGALARGELRIEKAVSDEDIDIFARSIGNTEWVKPAQRAAQVVLHRNGTVACAGSGHFLITIRRELLSCLPSEPSLKPLGAGSDEKWYDRPLDQHGYWRLASPRAFAYHIGNIPEPWMYDELTRWAAAREAATDRPSIDPGPLPAVRRPLVSAIPWAVRRNVTRLLQKTRLVGALRPRPSLLARRSAG
jgi:hypothetical protein